MLWFCDERNDPSVDVKIFRHRGPGRAAVVLASGRCAGYAKCTLIYYVLAVWWCICTTQTIVNRFPLKTIVVFENNYENRVTALQQTAN